MNDIQRKRAEKLRADGGSIRSIAADLDISTYKVRKWIEEVTAVVPPPDVDGPKVLVYDIENAPNLIWAWDTYQTNAIDIEQHWYMLSFAYKWLGEDETYFVSIYDDPNFVPDTDDDSYVMRRLLELFNLADVVIAHNGKKFDQKKAQARMFKWGMEPPSPYLEIDTLVESRKYFNLASHSLNNIAKFLGLGHKVQHTGFDLWRRCMKGDPEAWPLMEKYNVQDVDLLEEVYIAMLPWLGSPGKSFAVNASLFYEEGDICTRPGCGGTEFIKDGYRYTKTNKYQAWKCKRCGGKKQSGKAEPKTHEGPVDR